ncbi:MAG: ABC transporter permease [Pedosphaera sp.]|nr:ABC transporter permease [Pedosphaera sp.]
MTFLPVVERELRVAARRRSTYWTRCGAGLMAIVACAWMWWSMAKDVPSAQLSTTLFATISGFALAYSLLAGVRVTADCLSDEKREGTLGLLFLTDLKGYDVVLGKLVATSVNSFYRLLAIFPVLAIPLLLGGLTSGEFWRIVLVLCNALFFSLSAGMFLSALSRQERKAMLGTFALIFVITAAFPLIGLIVSAQHNSPFDLAYALPSAVYAFGMAQEAQFITGPNNYWSSVLTTHLLAWAFLVLASVIVPYSWQDKPSGAKKVRWRERWQLCKFGDMATRRAFRTRLLEMNPFCWLAGRDRLKPAYVWACLGLGGCAWAYLFFQYPTDTLDSATYVPTAFLLHTILKFWVAAEACRPLAEERHNGSLELLLSTPLSVEEILRGQILALKRQFVGPVFIILLIDLIMCLAGRNDRWLETAHDWTMLCIGGILMFVADLYTLAWVGMWLGLTAKKASFAASGALMRVLGLPWFLLFGLTSVMMLAFSGFAGPQNFFLGAWFIIGMLNNLFFFTRARTKLSNEFRDIVSQRFERKARGGWWPFKSAKASL